MRIFCKGNERIWKNAEFILKDLAGGKSGETLLVIADGNSYTNARALCDCARDFGLRPIIIDIDMYGGRERYLKMPVINPLKAAILNADICFMVTDQMLTDYGMFLGDSDDCDQALLGKSRRYTLEARGMDEWEIDREEILHYRERTEKLLAWLKTAGRLHVTTALGTDFTCEMGGKPDGMYSVLAIIPFYAEVAIVPNMGNVTGKLVVDGASQCAYGQRGFPIRPAIHGYQELYKQPLKISLEKGVVTDYSGDPAQVKRLKTWMESSVPQANIADEVGLVTTTSVENDKYGWYLDGTHQTHTVHVALGNNTRRNEVIHAPEHVDFDMHNPVIELDGNIIYRDGVFNDELIFTDHAKKAKP